MPSDWTTDRAEIPPSGERQDLTLSEIGFDRNRKPEDGRGTRIVIRGVIDNGEYQGFRVSTGFLVPSVNSSFRSFLEASRIIDTRFVSDTLDPARCVKLIKSNFEKGARFSAVVRATEKKTESERIVKYRLEDFGEPRFEAELILQSEPQQFKRKV